MPTKISLVGLRFSKLVVLAEAESRITARGNIFRRSLCQCDCGNQTIVHNSALRMGNTKSCGCGKGHRYPDSVPNTYDSWRKMVSRCTNPNDPSYANYGGRGITVCEEWRISFKAFQADLGERPGWLTLGRINNEMGYFPGNVRWETRRQQMGNTRRNRILTVRGVTACIRYLCEHFNVPYYRTRSRLGKLGWEPEKAFFGRGKTTRREV